MSQSYTYENLRPTAPQLLYLLNNTAYRERIIDAASNTPLINHLISDYQFVQRQHQHFDSLMNTTNLQMNRIAVNIAASGFTIPGQLTVPMICAPTIFIPHASSPLDYSPSPRGETPSTTRLEYPPRPPLEALEDYELVESTRPTSAPPLPTPPPQDEPQHPQNPSPNISDSESNLAQRLRTSPLPPDNSSIEPLPHPSVFHLQSLQTTTPRVPGPLETGALPRTLGTPPLGHSDQLPPNSPLENNTDDETTEPRNGTSSSPTNQISMTDFLDAIGAINTVTIHRTVKTTSAQSVTQSNLTISLTIAHNYDTVNKFLSHALPEVIHLLMALRMTMVIPPPSPTSLTSPTSTEEEEEPPIYTVVHITNDREPFTMTTDDREERCFVLVRYVNGAVVFEAGTSNVNRG
ncbi:hypothetical protein Moror_9618 [Moniliophthora roreri MCA 2997]|uniref:Uncharacterized protein n=2 Tax=Moniliophthora roreri TaxID=221103 RepID=V2WMT3_MONRO|nr:hypothetical protein Moror_9618 [Moniliophthora roreri MCA 2997]